MTKPALDFRVPFILWGALFSSTFMLLAVVFVAAPPPAEPLDPMLVPILGAVAVGEAIMSFVLPAQLLRNGLQRLSIPTREIQDPTALPGLGKTLRVPIDSAAAVRALMTVTMTPFILALALSEAVALTGFSLGFMGAPKEQCLPFFIASWVLLLLRFPRPKALIEHASRTLRIQFDG
jgi:hypothetical protein